VSLLTFLPQLARLRLLAAVSASDGIVLTLAARHRTAPCPLCGRRARRVQSRYARRVADLPIAGQRVTLCLQVRRFFCRNRRCPRVIFAERFPDLVPAYGRRTVAQGARLQDLGCTTGGSVGARLARALGLPVSRDTVLRLVRAMPAQEPASPHVLGVDDWAKRRGCSYGTILVDEERRRPLALLPERTSEVVATWLQQHGGVEVVTRDRAAAYADGITRGAPAAVQVADRFHLAKNLGDAVLQVLSTQSAQLAGVTVPTAADTAAAATGDRVASPPARADSARRATRLARYERVVALHAQGWTQAAIARAVGIGERTVLRWLTAGTFPERKPRRRAPDPFAPYAAYLTQRWAEGCQNATQLWRAVCEQGYQGASSGIWAIAQRLRRGEVAVPPPDVALAVPQRATQPLTPKRLVGIILRRAADRSAEEQQLLTAAQETCSQVREASRLSEQFLTLLRDRLSDAFDGWLKAAQTCGLSALQQFARGLEREVTAVRAALKLPYSNGQTEGQITRLKLIKRSMYGRAKLDLLERRVLYRAAA
jgi:transposase